MNHGFKVLSLGLGILAGSTCSSDAAVIAQYNFDAGNGVATTVNPNVTAQDIIQANAGPNMTVDYAPVAPAYPTPILRSATVAANPTNDEAGAVSAGTYFAFTVTPTAGNTMTLTGISFDSARGGAAVPRSWYAFSSVKGFANGSDIASAIEASQRPAFSHYDETSTVGGTAPLATGSLNLAADPSYANLTSPVTFRFYVSAPGAGQSIDFDNVSINGITTATSPEPATLGMAAIGGLCLLARRRRASR
jgi:hypothetical protein